MNEAYQVGDIDVKKTQKVTETNSEQLNPKNSSNLYANKKISKPVLVENKFKYE